MFFRYVSDCDSVNDTKSVVESELFEELLNNITNDSFQELYNRTCSEPDESGPGLSSNNVTAVISYPPFATSTAIDEVESGLVCPSNYVTADISQHSCATSNAIDEVESGSVIPSNDVTAYISLPSIASSTALLSSNNLDESLLQPGKSVMRQIGDALKYDLKTMFLDFSITGNL